MKKLLQLLLFSMVLWSCNSQHDLSIRHSEDEKVYEFSADFDKSETAKVQDYLDQKFNTSGDFKFKNAEIDATMTLDNDMTFYVKSTKGRLKIEFDREENTHENYLKIKEICKGLNKVLTQKS